MIRFFLFLLLLVSNYTFSQTVNYNKIITAQDSTFEEKLIEIAWKNYPENEGYRKLVEKSKKEVFQAQMRWTRNLRLSYNFNNKILEDGTMVQKPLVGLGVGVNLGDFILLPNTTKIAKKDVAIAEANLNTQKLHIRSEVLKRYYTYLLALDLLKVRTASYEDVVLINKMIREKYKNSKANLTEFNEAEALLNKKLEELLTQKTQLAIAKTSLEELLAVELDDIPGYKEMLNQRQNEGN